MSGGGTFSTSSGGSGDGHTSQLTPADTTDTPHEDHVIGSLEESSLPSVLLGPRFILGQDPHVIGGGAAQDSPMLHAAMGREPQGAITMEHGMLPASASMSVSISPLAHMTAGGGGGMGTTTLPSPSNAVVPPSVPVQVGLPHSYDLEDVSIPLIGTSLPFRAGSAPELEGGGEPPQTLLLSGHPAPFGHGAYLSATPAAKRLHTTPAHGMGFSGAAAAGGQATGPPRLPAIGVGHAATAGRLARLLGKKRVIVISYHLPVILRRSSDGTWAATWDVDNFLARSKHSVASELQVIWVGCVTRRCVDAVTASEGTRQERSSDVGRLSEADVDAAVAAMDAAGASAATLAAATAAAAQAGSDSTMATITTSPADVDGSRSAGHRYSFATPDTSGEGADGSSVTLQVPSAGIGSSPLGPLDGGNAGHSKGSTHTRSALGGPVQPPPHVSSPHATGAVPSPLPIAEPPTGASSHSVSDEDILELTAADRDAIRAALRPMNVVPVFLGHDNVVMTDTSVTDESLAGTGTCTATVDASTPAGTASDAAAATDRSAADGSYWYGRPDEPGSYRQLVPTHAVSASAAETAAAPVAVASGLTRHMVRDFGLYCSSVLRAAMNNVLDLGDANSIFAQSAEDYSAPTPTPEEEAAAAEDADMPHARPVPCSGLDQSITSRTYRLRSQGWKSYSRVNEYIARVAAAAMQPGDIVWTHDYHLCMVPHFLTRLVTPPPPQVFYMHASWPTSEVFRSLAEREQLLNGMLQADVIGFHTFNHARHFLQCCKRILGLNYASRGGRLGLDCRGRDVVVDITHMGVDVPVLNEWMASEEAAAFARALRTKYPNRVIIGGFDVCQRLSGIALKLLAYERLMEENPRYHDRVVLVQRCEMRDAPDQDTAKTSAEIKQLVARIRSRFGAVIDYAEAVAYPPTYRIGLFHCSDVLLHTPLREGLNLVPLQYVYVRTRWELQRVHGTGTSGTPNATSTGSESPQGTGVPSSDSGTPSHSTSSGVVSEGGSKPPLGAQDSSSKKAAARPSAKRGLFSMLGSLFSSHGRRGTPTIPEVEEGEAASPTAAGQGGHGSPEEGPNAHTTAFAGATGLAGIRLGGGYRNSPAARGGGGHTVAGGATPTGAADAGHSLGEDTSSVGGASLASSSPALSGIAGGELQRIESQAELAVPVNSEPLVAPLPPPPRGGCVVLSEASTASHILNSHIVVNPWAVSDTATALDKGLRMDNKERAVRQMRDYLYATRNPSYRWARQILTDVVESRMTFGHGQFVEMEASELTTVTRRTTLGGARSSSEGAAPSTALQQDVSSVGGSPVVTGLPAPPHTADSGGTGTGFDAALPSAGDRVNSLKQLSLDSVGSARHGASFNAELLLLERREVLSAFVRAKKRVLFVDYGGTLIEREGMGTYVKHEFIGSTRRRKLPMSVVSAIGALSADPATELWIVTGLSADVIGNTQLAQLPHLNIAAENGAVVSHGAGTHGAPRRWTQDPNVLGGGIDAKAEWDSVKDVAEQIMREYQWRVTGAVIRSAATSVVFDYRNADPEWAQAQTKYLTGDLARRLVSPLVKVHQRKSRVEVSLRGATRRQLVRHGLSLAPDADFVAAIGDDASDEEMFTGVMEAFAAAGQGAAGGVGRDLQSVFTITVGRKRTGARYFLPDVAHVQLLLTGLSQVSAVLPALPSDEEDAQYTSEEPPSRSASGPPDDIVAALTAQNV